MIRAARDATRLREELYASYTQEIPFLSELQSREASRGLRVVGVDVDEAADREGVLAAEQRLGIRYTVWLDPDASVKTLKGTSAVPASVLIEAPRTNSLAPCGGPSQGHAGICRGLGDAARALSGPEGPPATVNDDLLSSRSCSRDEARSFADAWVPRPG